MDATDRDNATWRTTKNRTWLVGFNAEENPPGGPNTKVNDPLAAAKTQLGYSTAGCGQPDDRCPDMRRPPSGGQRGPSGALAPGGRGQCATAQPRRGAVPLSR